jgi:hypothetical protein
MATKVTYPRPILSQKVTGSYRIAKTTGTIAAALAAGGQVFQWKFTAGATATPQVLATVAIITRLRVRFLPLTPFTAATLADHTSFDAFVCRPLAAGFAGGSAVTLSTNNAKLQTSMATTLAAAQIATTAALTAATGMDATPFAHSVRTGNRVNPAAATEEVIQPINNDLEFYPQLDGGEPPLVLAGGEGIVIANRTVWPAAGTGIVAVEMCWTEAIGY